MTKRYAIELLKSNIKQQYGMLDDYCATMEKHNLISTFGVEGGQIIESTYTPNYCLSR